MDAPGGDGDDIESLPESSREGQVRTLQALVSYAEYAGDHDQVRGCPYVHRFD
jgi:hypothetical protein